MSVEPSELLHYLPDHKVIVCTSCQYALQPTGISRHLKDIHHILRSRRKPFEEYISHFDLADPETVIRSTDNLKEYPVPGLPVQEGLRCNYKGCSHLCVTEKRMRNHWTLEHGQLGRPEIDWSPVSLQTFFRGNALRYFTKPSFSQSAFRYLPKEKYIIGDDEAALMQHYIHSTSLTLADEPRSPDDDDPMNELLDAPLSLWQEAVPELAETSHFLKHGIMACSALHLAYLNTSERQSYSIAAAKHQALAIQQFRPEVANLNDDNCHAIIAFIHILSICSFASEQENERLLIVDPDGPGIVSDWLSFMRSGCNYVHTVQHIVEAGPLRVLLCNYMFPADLCEGPKIPMVERLLAIIPSPASEDAWSELDCYTYRTAVQELGYAFVFAERLGTRFNIWVALRVWPIAVSIAYLRLVRDEHPGALIALAQYCVLLRRLDGKWYVEGRAKRLLSHILHRLDPRWHSCIDWSMDSSTEP